MLYLEDYLEVIEHLPQELQNRFTDIREMDLQVHNDIDGLDEKVTQFFSQFKKFKPEQKKQEYDQLVNSYKETMKYADEKCHIANQMHETVQRLIRRLDGELEKFKVELEADNIGITEELEQRSLEMDRDTSICSNNLNNHATPASIKERRRSHATQNHHNAISNHNNGYHHHPRQHHHNNHHQQQHHYDHDHTSAYRAKSKHKTIGSKAPQSNNHQNNHSVAHDHRLISPSSFNDGRHSVSAPASVVDETSFGSELLSIISNEHQITNGRISNHHLDMQNNRSTIMSEGNRTDLCNSGKQPRKNLMASPGQQHSALSAALAAAPSNIAHLNSLSTIAMMNAAASAGQQRTTLNGYPSGAFITGDTNNLLPVSIRHNPIAAAASQAIAATQQMQQGRRTPSLKASYAAINAGIHNINTLDFTSTSKDALSNRNALAPVVDDQLSNNNRYNQQFRASQTPVSQSMTGTVSPLYISVTKSGRASKRPRHASHIYQDESPTSISSNNSIFENSESLPSTDFSESATTLGLSSPTALEFTTNMYQKDEKRYCVCRQISYGEMVACDNDQCEFEWFHYDCVGVTQPPKGKWFCPDCTRKLAQVHQPPHKKRGRKEKSISLAQNSDLNRNLNELHHQQQPKQTIIES